MSLDSAQTEAMDGEEWIVYRRVNCSRGKFLCLYNRQVQILDPQLLETVRQLAQEQSMGKFDSLSTKPFVNSKYLIKTAVPPT